MTHQEIILELLSAQKRQAEIAKRAGCSQGFISQIARGDVKECGWAIGEALREMHAEVMTAAGRKPLPGAAKDAAPKSSA